jgi:diaminohydroxyphosphoribosylaminopyrimidine deaminase / 5-amino-6-(5-phosphoribosylamino)uracil reductase
MSRCLELAARGLGYTGRNPLVGAVLVHNGRIIGEGYHAYFGGPHAEINALAQVTEIELLSESTLYVNLEPCSHFGKTPPCAHAIVQAGVGSVVYGMKDPNPLVSGRGLAHLKEHGIAVVGPILQAENEWLNRRFLTHLSQQRPWILLKWAQSADAFIDPIRGVEQKGSLAISSPLAQPMVHQWRAQESAILIGVQTAINDLPKLNVRASSGLQPLRIVIDPHQRLPLDHPLLHDGLPLLLVHAGDEKQSDTQRLFIPAPFNLHNLASELYLRGIASLLVEGGAHTLQAFIEARLWDEARIIQSPNRLEMGLSAPIIDGQLIEQYQIGVDTVRHYLPVHPSQN